MGNDAFDVVVIGAGPGGYTAAIRASQLGLRTAIVEKRPELGGTCLNVGCIPAKALLDATEFYTAIRDKAERQGIHFDNLRFVLSEMMEKKRLAVERHTKGVALLMRENKIETIRGSARIAAPGRVRIAADAGKVREVAAGSIVLATGSVPVPLPSVPFDGDRIISSDEALSLDAVPDSLLVIGAGAVGLEIGSIWMRLGSRVTVIELMDQVLPGADLQAARALMQILKKQGMEFSLSTSVSGCKTTGKKVELTSKNSKGGEMTFTGDRVLVAVGRKPYLAELGLEEAGVRLTEKGRVGVNERYETSAGGIFAIGDIIDGPMLAHKAGEEGVAVAELIAGKAGHVNYDTIPGAVYTWPELAFAGLTEEQCRGRGIPIRTGLFFFRANSRGTTSDNSDGFVKIIAHEETDRVLGCSIVGPWASDLIHELVILMEFGGSSEDAARTVHAHPSFSEAVREAALDVEGRALHTPPGLNIRRTE